MRAPDLADRVRVRYPDVVVSRDEVAVFVDRDDLLGALAAFRDDPNLSLDFLSSVTAVDWPERTPRFWVAYELTGVEHHHRLRVKVGLSGEDPRIPSIVSLFPTADWHERETWDLFGIEFEGHPGLVRILLPDDWEGFPLRKSEELGGVNTRYEGAFIPPVDRRTT